MSKVKGFLRKALALVSVSLMGCMASVAAFAVEDVNPYASISDEITKQSSQMFISAQTMVIAVIGSGLVIFGIFLMFKLGKRGISSATSSKG